MACWKMPQFSSMIFCSHMIHHFSIISPSFPHHFPSFSHEIHGEFPLLMTLRSPKVAMARACRALLSVMVGSGPISKPMTLEISVQCRCRSPGFTNAWSNGTFSWANLWAKIMANKVENMLAGVFVMRFIYRFMGYESGINGICMCNKSMEYGINRYDDIIYI